jgi:glucose/arabinose dehydrogenase
MLFMNAGAISNWRRWSSVGLVMLLALLIGLTLNLHPGVGNPARLSAQSGEIDLALEQFATDFVQPTDIANAGDGRLFVAERSGMIYIVQADGVRLPTPFLDLRTKVNTEDPVHGLLGLTFEPQDASTFYVHYISQAKQSVIARYRTVTGDPNQGDLASEQVVLTIDFGNGYHNGGDLAFGPDGHLYIPYGTGPGGGSSNTNAQNLSTLLGKVLRIHVTGESTYSIPDGNPFADDNDPETLAEIWSYGWRNPWRLAFDRATGAMFVADVGELQWEEISHEPPNTPGRNYGWQRCEASYVYPPDDEGERCPTDPFVPPIFEYRHGSHCSVIGGFVYRGTRYPNMVGHYLLADFCSSTYWSVTANGQGGWHSHEHGKRAQNPNTFGEDAEGELYVTDYNRGILYHVVDRSPVTATATPLPSPTATRFTPVATLDQKRYLPVVGQGEK